MPAAPSRAHLLAYALVAIALLLVGARALRASGDGAAQPFEAETAQSSEGSGLSIGAGGPDVVVDVTGAVVRPGVDRLPAGARVTDAVRRAGGPTGRAGLEAINLAARLADGQQVLVPERGPGGAGVAAAISDEGPISLGSASAEQLETIDGIGPVTAADILSFRDEHGGLASVDQLDQVSGIGPATMESLRERLQP
jgi:competence protein ComEA